MLLQKWESENYSAAFHWKKIKRERDIKIKDKVNSRRTNQDDPKKKK